MAIKNFHRLTSKSAIALCILSSSLAWLSGPSSAASLQDATSKDIAGASELIVMLSDTEAGKGRVWSLISTAVQNDAMPVVERAFIEAVNGRHPQVLAAFGVPTSAHFFVDSDRMTDSDRALKARRISADGSAGSPGDPRERLERYMILRYETAELARAAFAMLKGDPAVELVNSGAVVAALSAPVVSDPYFAQPFVASPATPSPSLYQWGLHQMQFPTAWDTTLGSAYLGVIDIGLPGEVSGGTLSTHFDLIGNYRPHLTPYGVSQPSTSYRHTIHVSGILAATQNNVNSSIAGNGTGLSNGGISGACPGCSFVTYPVAVAAAEGPGGPSTINSQVYWWSKVLMAAVDGGMQIVNWSGGIPAVLDQYGVQAAATCTNAAMMCDTLAYATDRGVLVAVAAGNDGNSYSLLNNGPQFPGYLTDNPYLPNSQTPNTNQFSVLPVAGLMRNAGNTATVVWTSGLTQTTAGCTGLGRCELGSNNATRYGVAAPAMDIVSAMTPGQRHNNYQQTRCGDSLTNVINAATGAPITGVPVDASSARYANGGSDGIGTCTGTSMAAPHIAALAGLIASINPRLPVASLRNIIRNSGNLAGAPTLQLGYGMPSATAAVSSALATNPSRLTPLLSYYSASRTDSFYTVVPQMARAAVEGFLRPKLINSTYDLNTYYPTYGYLVSGYWLPPGSPFVIGPSAPNWTNAEVWVFTTPLNPKNAVEALEPLVRMSWKCGDTVGAGYAYPTSACANTGNRHVDTLLAHKDEVNTFAAIGYKVDGTEGFVYPRSGGQPAGTVKLLRRYNPTRDDYAVFPESSLGAMTAAGYTQTVVGTGLLGYAYPNSSSGTMPTIQ